MHSSKNPRISSTLSGWYCFQFFASVSRKGSRLPVDEGSVVARRSYNASVAGACAGIRGYTLAR